MQAHRILTICQHGMSKTQQAILIRLLGQVGPQDMAGRAGHPALRPAAPGNLRGAGVIGRECPFALHFHETFKVLLHQAGLVTSSLHLLPQAHEREWSRASCHDRIRHRLRWMRGCELIHRHSPLTMRLPYVFQYIYSAPHALDWSTSTRNGQAVIGLQLACNNATASSAGLPCAPGCAQLSL